MRECRNALITLARTTAAAPSTPAPTHDTTPPDVYALGKYCKIMFRGMEREITAAAMKNAM